MTETNILGGGNGENLYIPSSSEKKRVVMMYFVIGLFFFFPKEEMTIYEYYHFKQSLGRMSLFFVALFASVILFFLPILKWLGMFLILILVGFGIYFIRQAWEGKYPDQSKNPFFGFFGGLGNWILSLFEVNKRVIGLFPLDNGPQITTLDQNLDASTEDFSNLPPTLDQPTHQENDTNDQKS